MGIHTALDTNGSLGSRLADQELEEIDLVLLDIKTWDPERHRQLTGMDVAPVLDFARRLAARKRAVWLRFVLVPGLTDDLEDIRQIAKFTAGLGNFERVDILPFHQMGRFKWKELKLNYTLNDVQPPSQEEVERAREPFRAAGLKAYRSRDLTEGGDERIGASGFTEFHQPRSQSICLTTASCCQAWSP